VATPLKAIPSGLSSERAAAFRPLTISRSDERFVLDYQNPAEGFGHAGSV
jgi:hypothetical protein